VDEDVDEGALVRIGGLELGGVGLFEFPERCLAFVADDHALGVESRLEGVPAGGGLAGFGARAGAELGVAGVGLDLFFGRHK
jgi:hypothetical protein